MFENIFISFIKARSRGQSAANDRSTLPSTPGQAGARAKWDSGDHSSSKFVVVKTDAGRNLSARKPCMLYYFLFYVYVVEILIANFWLADEYSEDFDEDTSDEEPTSARSEGRNAQTQLIALSLTQIKVRNLQQLWKITKSVLIYKSRQN